MSLEFATIAILVAWNVQLQVLIAHGVIQESIFLEIFALIAIVIAMNALIQALLALFAMEL